MTSTTEENEEKFGVGECRSERAHIMNLWFDRDETEGEALFMGWKILWNPEARITWQIVQYLFAEMKFIRHMQSGEKGGRTTPRKALSPWIAWNQQIEMNSAH